MRRLPLPGRSQSYTLRGDGAGRTAKVGNDSNASTVSGEGTGPEPVG